MLQSTSSFNVHCAVSATANKSCLAWPQPFRLLKVLVAVTIFCYLLLVIICLAPIHSFSWSFVAKNISGSKPSQCHFSPPPCYGFGMNKLRSSQTWLWEFNFLCWSVVLLEYRRVTNTTHDCDIIAQRGLWTTAVMRPRIYHVSAQFSSGEFINCCELLPKGKRIKSRREREISCVSTPWRRPWARQKTSVFFSNRAPFDAF